MKPLQKIFFLIVIFVAASCSSNQTSTTRQDNTLSEKAKLQNYKFLAWEIEQGSGYSAANLLLKNADNLIKRFLYEAASDKVERSLRIKSNYAQAWSRLSWLALQMKQPKKAIQFAKRSNSFAFSNPNLQALNSAFILRANNMLST